MKTTINRPNLNLKAPRGSNRMKVERVNTDQFANMTMDTGDSNVPGQMYFANATRFTEAFFSEPLTAYAVGWRDPNNLEATLQFLAPSVPTTRRFEWSKATNAEEFLSETDEIRAIGADFKKIEFTSAKVNDRTLNKGLTMRVDLDAVSGMPNWRELWTGKIMRRLVRNEIRRSIALLSAAAITNTPVTWNTTAGKDPDQDVLVQIGAYADDAGIPPSRVLYGFNAWLKRRTAHRAQNTAGGFASALLTPQQVAESLQVDGVYVSSERFQNAATTKAQIVNNLVMIYFAEDNQTPEDPSNVKRFVSPTLAGTPYRVYEQQMSAHLVDISVEHYSQIVVTSTVGIQKLTVS